jgi:hypothetical protein
MGNGASAIKRADEDGLPIAISPSSPISDQAAEVNKLIVITCPPRMRYS